MHEIENILAKELKLIKKRKYKHAMWLYTIVLLFFSGFFLLYNIEYNQYMRLDELVGFHLGLALVVTVLYFGVMYLVKFFHVDEHVVRYHTNRLLKERKERQEKIEHEEKLYLTRQAIVQEINQRQSAIEKSMPVSSDKLVDSVR